MKFTIKREHLLKPLQQVSGPLSARTALPILANLLLQVSDNTLTLTGTDLEIEMVATIALSQSHKTETGSTTVPARKFFDICRGLPEDAEITVTLETKRLSIRSGHSRFSLSILSARDFPNLADLKKEKEVELTVSPAALKCLIDSTQFAMAHQDVRYYLNGMLFEVEGEKLCVITTDGHRLAVCSTSIIQKDTAQELKKYSVIVPRKAVIELARLLSGGEDRLCLQIGSNNIRVHLNGFIFTSKLVDGRFPDYKRVFPKNPSKIVIANCEQLKQAFSRAAILSNAKFRGVRLHISAGKLKITANNPEQEEAEETLDVDYQGEDIEISFNVGYLLDVLNALKCDKVKLLLIDSVSSVQIENIENQITTYIVMPMRL